MSQTVGIVGSGIVGRVVATLLVEQGEKVTLFESRPENETTSCSQVAAGMLSPFAEIDHSDERIWALGVESLEIWPSLLRGVEDEVFFQREGTVMVALPAEAQELIHLEQKVREQVSSTGVRRIDRKNLTQLEPELDPRFSSGLYFPLEAQIDGRTCLKALSKKIQKGKGEVHFDSKVTEISPYEIKVATSVHPFDWCIDCRGLEARNELPLRGVRGELFLIESSEVHFNRPVRLIHPRHPLYVVPRPHGKFIVGATCIESEDETQISVRSSLDLLSMAFALHSGFGEARILETRVQRRPAFRDNFPRIYFKPGLLRINGMYRHGYLLSPVMAQAAIDLINGRTPSIEPIVGEGNLE